MKRLLIPLLAALALPTAVNAETSLAEKMSAEQKNVAVLKAFNQCKINQGLSAETLKKQAYEVLDSYRIDKQLLNNNDITWYTNSPVSRIQFYLRSHTGESATFDPTDFTLRNVKINVNSTLLDYRYYTS